MIIIKQVFMSRIILALFALTISFSVFANNDKKNGTTAYVDAYVEIAISEMKRTGIPASIKLAQAILESNAGRSEMAMMANNHFGIKCGNDWRGTSYYKIDDDKDHRGKLIESCFRVYKDATESFIAHSNFLQNNGRTSRYDFLFDYKTTDYKKWAKGLRKAGYATDPNYPQKLINLIEKYELYRYDSMGSPDFNHNFAESTNQEKPTDKPTTDKPRVSREDRTKDVIASSSSNFKMPRSKFINEAKTISAKGGETLNDISNASGIPLASLVAFNDNQIEPYEVIPAKSTIYLEKKRLSLKGKKKFHQVRDGETMGEIAQKYGIELEALYIRNRIPFGSEVKTGEKVMLKGLLRTGKKPELSKKSKSGVVEKSRFVEETVEYIFSKKNGN
ncbi:N-acetylmuramoyl-L-alanine amidase [Portibacter lacus]|uniref:Peptidoglycan hydrolase n=2 Tax=Portibacter lacus TaxID=1099794 RepID=A0AA37SRL3_9BACT|nr:N-acetylmuramoyl-L-alanine amidase [Portibacter lacus]